MQAEKSLFALRNKGDIMEIINKPFKNQSKTQKHFNPTGNFGKRAVRHLKRVCCCYLHFNAVHPLVCFFSMEQMGFQPALKYWDRCFTKTSSSFCFVFLSVSLFLFLSAVEAAQSPCLEIILKLSVGRMD